MHIAFVQKGCATKLVDLLKIYFPRFYSWYILDLGASIGYITEKFNLSKVKWNILDLVFIGFVISNLIFQ